MYNTTINITTTGIAIYSPLKSISLRISTNEIIIRGKYEIA